MENESPFDNHRLFVIDMQGRVLLNKEIRVARNSKTFVDLGFLKSNGIYIVRVENTGGLFSKKIVYRK
jgi:hypothetical protein